MRILPRLGGGVDDREDLVGHVTAVDDQPAAAARRVVPMFEIAAPRIVADMDVAMPILIGGGRCGTLD